MTLIFISNLRERLRPDEPVSDVVVTHRLLCSCVCKNGQLTDQCVKVLSKGAFKFPPPPAAVIAIGIVIIMIIRICRWGCSIVYKDTYMCTYRRTYM